MNVFSLYARFVPSLLVVLMIIPMIGYSADRGPMQGVTADSSFVIYYGDDYYTNTDGAPSTWQINQAVIDKLSRFDVVVLQPNQPHCTPEVVDMLKANGADYVLGYISIGEEFIDDAFESPLEGGSGMLRYDVASERLVPSSGNSLQSFYMDVDSQNVTYDANGTVIAVETIKRLSPDGKPDYNPSFLGYMVNPDANWRWVIDNMRIGTNDVFGRTLKAGLKQLAGNRSSADLRNRSSNFGFDGFFLDTLDTAGPYDGAGWYPWTIQEMHNTVKYISDNYSDKQVFANRGAFFFSPGLISPITQEYSIDYSIRPYVNAFLFESFRYDSDPSYDGEGGVSEFYNENRFNVAPKVLAEANRNDGFTVFSLEYESGRTNIVDDAFDTGIRQLGFVGYLADNRLLNTIDTDFLDRLPDFHNDDLPPTWETTGHTAYNTPYTNPRVGVQSVSLDEPSGEVVISWDIAFDQSMPIQYHLVVTHLVDDTETVFTNIGNATHNEWLYNPSLHGANEFRVNGLSKGERYRFRIIAEDARGNKNVEDLGVELTLGTVISNPIIRSDITFDGFLDEWSSWSAYPADADDMAGVSPSGHISGTGNQANWRQIQMAHSTDTNELFLAYTNETNIYISWGFQIFLDTDNDASTGFQGGFAGIGTFPIGADYLIEGVNIHQYAGDGSTWSWVMSPASQGYEIGRIWSGHTGEVFLPLHWIGNPAGTIKFIVFGNNSFYGHDGEYDWYPDNAAQGGYFQYQF